MIIITSITIAFLVAMRKKIVYIFNKFKYFILSFLILILLLGYVLFPIHEMAAAITMGL